MARSYSLRSLLIVGCFLPIAAFGVVAADISLPDTSSTFAADPTLDLRVLTTSEANKYDAACLDGSPPAFYISGPGSGSNATTTKWVLYFKGGGWCYTTDGVGSCADRATTTLGSSKPLPPHFDFAEGPSSSNPKVNPFVEYRRVILWYCDGSSFSSSHTGTVPATTSNGDKIDLYFRGKQNLEAIMAVLLEQYGLSEATDVLLAGGSAGGLSTFLHADRVGSMLPPSVGRFKAMPFSGYFLDHDDASGYAYWPDLMVNAFRMFNATSGVNQDCVASQKFLAGKPSSIPGVSGPEACFFAQESYRYTKTPMMPIQSTLDLWQMENIWAPRANTTGWDACIKDNFEACTPDQAKRLVGYEAYFMDLLKSTPKFARDGEGAFLSTCLSHVAGQGSGWTHYEIDGTSMVQAAVKWWESSTSTAAQHYLPCQFKTTTPYQCNPSCTAK